MKRRALLIADPGPSTSYLDGPAHDLQNYYDFLLSALGGGWLPEEVDCLFAPTRAEVLARHRLLQDADFTLIVYSGHGFMDQASQQSGLVLGERSEQLLVNKLVTPAARQLVILDSCRSYAASLQGLVTEGLQGTPVTLTRAQARRAYDRWLKQAEEGWVVWYGCQPGQFSYDSPSGGHFSNALFGVAHDWVLTPGRSTILPIDRACQYAGTRLPARKQQPLVQSSPRQRKFWFPFALKQVS